jgi:hypothetical protein
MSSATGTATIDFGAWPGTNEAVVYVTGQTSILSTSKASAFIMADDLTGDHSSKDHRYLSSLVGFSCGTPTAGTGFGIFAHSVHKLSGQFLVRWVWVD